MKKSYTLTPEQQVSVDAELAKSKEEYKSIAHIIMEKDLPDELIAALDAEDFVPEEE